MSETKSEEANSAATQDGEITVIGSGTIVLGAVTTEHDLHVHGRIEGPIDAAGIVKLGASAIVRGNVSADHVVIAGRVEGTVVAHVRMHVLARGSVIGDAQYGSLEVERGGVIDGRSSPIASTATVAIATRAVDGLIGGHADASDSSSGAARAVSAIRAMPPPPRATAVAPRSAASSLPPPPPHAPLSNTSHPLARANGG